MTPSDVLIGNDPTAAGQHPQFTRKFFMPNLLGIFSPFSVSCKGEFIAKIAHYTSRYACRKLSSKNCRHQALYLLPRWHRATGNAP